MTLGQGVVKKRHLLPPSQGILNSAEKYMSGSQTGPGLLLTLSKKGLYD